MCLPDHSLPVRCPSGKLSSVTDYLGGKTVKKRVNEILAEHGEHMILITLGINTQSVIIETDQKIRQSENPRQRPLTNSRAFHRLEGYGLQPGPKKGN